MQFNAGRQKKLSAFLLVLDVLLIAFIISRGGSPVVVGAGKTENPRIVISHVPSVGNFYPDTLSFRGIAPEPLASYITAYGSSGTTDSLIFSTASLPGEWTRYDSLLILITMENNRECLACARIGNYDLSDRNENNAGCITVPEKSSHQLGLMISLAGYKRQHKKLPLGESIIVDVGACGAAAVSITDIRAIRHEN